MEVRRGWTREDLRDSLIALYQGRVRPNDIPKKFNQVSRQRAQVLVTRIPPGLHFTNEDWSLLRAASELSGCSAFSRRLYTDAEMRNALKAVHGKELTQKEASARFGPKVATIQKYLSELRKMLHAGFTLERALLALNFPSPGPRPLLNADEVHLLVAKADVAADHGKGFTRRRVSGEAKGLCQALAEKENDPKKRERLENAICGKNWRKRALSTLNTSFRKASDLSERRAAAKHGESTREMFRRITKMYEAHRAAGVLDGAEPDSDQVWNADEVGFDPKGRWQHVLTSSKDQRIFRTTTGEKAPFWVTAWLMTRADGQCFVPPAIIHQGSQLSEFHTLGIPSDWIVHSTPSGYQDREGFLKVCSQFLEYCGPKRPQYLFLDGHDSHFDADALDHLAADGIHVFFLKANNSEQDQPNDNGPNSVLKACYDARFDDWLHQYDGVPFNGAFFNAVFVPAWRDWKAKASGAIARAFSDCGLWPLNECAPNYLHGNEQLSAKFSTTTLASSHLHADNASSATAPESESPNPSAFLRPRQGNEYTLLRAKVGAPDRSILIRSAAHEYFRSSNVVPAQHLQEVLREQQSAKKNRVDPSAFRAQSLNNPSTSSGLYVSDAVRKRCREVQQAREDAREAKRRAGEKLAEKKAEKQLQEKAAFEDVIGRVTRNELAVSETGLQGLSVRTMRDCLRGMGQATPSKTKKAELITTLLPRLLLAKAAADDKILSIEPSETHCQGQ